MNKFNEDFIEDFIKEMIIKSFEDYMLLQEGLEIVISRGYSEPMLKMGGNDEFQSFVLTNCSFFNMKYECYKTYTINGVMSVLNGGRIIITSYDITDRFI